MDQLVAMGFGSQAAADALDLTGGNIESALEYLLTGALPIGTPQGSGTQQQGNVLHSHHPSSSDDVVIPLEVSQYSFAEAGTSACTAISAAVMKHLLDGMERRNLAAQASELTNVMMEGVRHYQALVSNRALGSSSEHLSIDELGPMMFNGLHAVVGEAGALQGLLTQPRAFAQLFSEARSIADASRCIGIVITKPPETVCVVLPPITVSATTTASAAAHDQQQQQQRQNSDVDSSNQGHQYLFFDSHSRPQLGFAGSYLVQSSSELGIINRLNMIFTPLPVDEAEGDENYMHIMYNTFEGYVFQSNAS